jgi:hypothetical protein
MYSLLRDVLLQNVVVDGAGKPASSHLGKLDAMGGMVKAIERGYPQKEIGEASYQHPRAVEANGHPPPCHASKHAAAA